MPYRLRVPASSANLGPGFDALGLALNLHLTCTVAPASHLRICCSGLNASEIPSDDSNLIWQTALSIASMHGMKLPAVGLHIENEIPIGKGLGSSAAALTAGVILANLLLDLNWSRRRILDEAACIEGHPDNVSACVLGSIVASSMDSSGTHAVRVDLPSNYGVAVVVPDFVLPTSHARSVLPHSYRREDVVFNVQRSALLIAALFTGNTDSFSAALQDRLHQPYRAPLVPGFSEMLQLHAEGLLGCALSGAGPSVLVFYQRGYESVAERFEQAFLSHGHRSKTYFTEIQKDGYTLEQIG